jgi:sulfur carrier protein ThiS
MGKPPDEERDMALTVKCYATLAAHTPPGGLFELAPDRAPVPPAPGCIGPGLTVAGLMAALGLSPDEVKVAFVNGLHAGMDQELKDGDRVGLFPAVGGG